MAHTNEANLTKLVYEGAEFKIEFYVRLSGETLAEDWLESMPKSIQQKFAALFAWIGNHGRIRNETKFKHLTGTEQIFEFKANDNRILCFFFIGKRLILTHGFKKKSDKTPKNEIEMAEKLKVEFQERSKRSTS